MSAKLANTKFETLFNKYSKYRNISDETKTLRSTYNFYLRIFLEKNRRFVESFCRRYTVEIAVYTSMRTACIHDMTNYIIGEGE